MSFVQKYFHFIFRKKRKSRSVKSFVFVSVFSIDGKIVETFWISNGIQECITSIFHVPKFVYYLSNTIASFTIKISTIDMFYNYRHKKLSKCDCSQHACIQNIRFCIKLLVVTLFWMFNFIRKFRYFENNLFLWPFSYASFNYISIAMMSLFHKKTLRR